MSTAAVVTLHPVGPMAFDVLLERLDDLAYQLEDAERRSIRLETRLCKLMQHYGLDEQGNPARATRRVA